MAPTTEFLASLMGPAFLCVGVSMLFNQHFYSKMIKRLDAYAPYLLVQAIFGIIIGLAVIRTHNVWTTPATILVSAIGWIGLLKGLSYLLAPERMITFARSLRDNIAALAWVTAIIGAYLTWVAYLQ